MLLLLILYTSPIRGSARPAYGYPSGDLMLRRGTAPCPRPRVVDRVRTCVVYALARCARSTSFELQPHIIRRNRFADPPPAAGEDDITMRSPAAALILFAIYNSYIVLPSVLLCVFGRVHRKSDNRLFRLAPALLQFSLFQPGEFLQC